MSLPGYVPSAGDLIWTDFDPTRGTEQAGRRPALVISAAAFSANTGLAVVCPITSWVRPFPTSVVLPPGLPVAGEILISHMRSIDTLVRYVGASVSPQVAQLDGPSCTASSRSDHPAQATAIRPSDHEAVSCVITCKGNGGQVCNRIIHRRQRRQVQRAHQPRCRLYPTR